MANSSPCVDGPLLMINLSNLCETIAGNMITSNDILHGQYFPVSFFSVESIFAYVICNQSTIFVVVSLPGKKKYFDFLFFIHLDSQKLENGVIRV